MRALVFDNSFPRLAATKILSQITPRAFVSRIAPIQLVDLPDPTLPADDWLTIRTQWCGMCGSDYKQVFLNGSTDNPMTAVVTFPQVLGHEVVGIVESVGPGCNERKVGDRVVLNPWLSCVTRGLAPCEWCQKGELAQCLNFTEGHRLPCGFRVFRN